MRLATGATAARILLEQGGTMRRSRALEVALDVRTRGHSDQGGGDGGVVEAEAQGDLGGVEAVGAAESDDGLAGVAADCGADASRARRVR